MNPEEVFQRFERDPGAFTRIPTATYRLQLGPEMTFAGLREIVPYLAALGVSDCHLSPFLQPCSQASHGYDVADHGRLNETLGSEAEYRALVEALQRHGMGQIMDVVPNHMGIAGSRNAWWTDVLENGRASVYADFFDIEWDPIKPELRDKVLLPMLGDQYGRVLENGELQLELRDGAFSIRYYDSVLPVAPRTYVSILDWRVDELERALGAASPELAELRSIVTALGHLPPQTEADPARRDERQREKEVAKRRLATLVRQSPAVRGFVEENVRRHNGVKGDPRSFDRLDALLARQGYRLSFWQTAGDEINYRRFFDINELAAIRVEEPAVFEAAHRLVFRLVREGAVTGLRIDHPDGLFAPSGYLRDLQRRCFVERARYLRTIERPDEPEPPGWGEAVLRELDRRVAERRDAGLSGNGENGGGGGAGLLRGWSAVRHAGRSGLARAVQAMLRRPRLAGGDLGRAFYIVTEKILMPEERLPQRWPAAGTTGYEFLNAVNGLFVDPAGARSLTATYARFTGARHEFAEVAYQAKRLVMESSMASEIAMLGRRLGRISEGRRSARDFTDRMLTEALREIVAGFPVYRTYIATGDGELAERDRRYVEAAVAEARRRNPSVSASIFEFIRELLCLELPDDMTDADRAEVLAFVGRFQQLTGPITAKGVEDTAFYRYHRLVSLNEVGSHPDVLGTRVEDFHRFCLERLSRWPTALSVLSTHDTKRGEDARARLDVLSEIPDEWRARVRGWQRMNRERKTRVDGEPAPDAGEEYLLYQTLVGAWPPAGADIDDAFVERIQGYMRKALREAKVHVSWINPRSEYDEAVHGFIVRVLDRSQPNEFLDDFRPFQARVAGLGVYNSLAQTLLRLAAPGVPEIYQGGELWDLSLVDPDNRRPVDFDERQAALAELRARGEGAGADLGALARALVAERADGRIKLHVVHRGLRHRRAYPQLFLRGDHLLLEARGSRAGHVCAFARSHAEQQVVVVVPRLLARLAGSEAPLGSAVWGEDVVVLPGGGEPQAYRNLFTGEVIDATAAPEGQRALRLASVFSSFPVAMLERQGQR